MILLTRNIHRFFRIFTDLQPIDVVVSLISLVALQKIWYLHPSSMTINILTSVSYLLVSSSFLISKKNWFLFNSQKINIHSLILFWHPTIYLPKLHHACYQRCRCSTTQLVGPQNLWHSTVFSNVKHEFIFIYPTCNNRGSSQDFGKLPLL